MALSLGTCRRRQRRSADLGPRARIGACSRVRSEWKRSFGFTSPANPQKAESALQIIVCSCWSLLWKRQRSSICLCVLSSQSDHAVCGRHERSDQPQRDGAVAVHADGKFGESSDLRAVVRRHLLVKHSTRFSVLVSPGGENCPEAAHRLRGVLRVQQSSAHQSRQHRGWTKRCAQKRR